MEVDGQLPVTQVSSDEPLEELELTPTLPSTALLPGTIVEWGGQTFVVTGGTLSGWYLAARGGTEDPLLLRPGPEWQSWAVLPKHRILPRVLYAGPEGCVIETVSGDPLQLPMSPATALDIARQVAQLVRFLFSAEEPLAVADIDPDCLVSRTGELAYRLLPRVGFVNQGPPRLLREGVTPPELLSGAPMSGKEGVYVTAAILLRLLTGEGVPPEASATAAACAVDLPGIRQFLTCALEAAEKRPDPIEALEEIRALSRPPTPLYRLGSASTIGLNPSRSLNEDSFGLGKRVVSAHERRSELVTACVADGMGGMAAGESASRAAVETFLASTSAAWDHISTLSAYVTQAAWDANRAVSEALAGRDGGCTFTGAVVVGTTLAIAHVGDTRAYLLSGDKLTQLTRDHSLVASLVANGMLTPSEAETSADQGKVLRSLGSLRAPQAGYIEGLDATVGTETIEMKPGEQLLLMSDGVWGDASHSEMLEILIREVGDPQKAADALIERVLSSGARDNATAVVVARVR